MLEVKNLKINRGNFQLQVSNLEIKKGEFVFLLGLNGSGKTTFFHALSKLIKVKEGEIVSEGKCLTELSPKEWAKKVALIEQDPAYPFPLTVLDYVLTGRFAYQNRFFEGKDDHTIAREAIHQVNLSKYENRLISQLSGGERRRAQIARALSQKPELLLLDEPFTFLDIKQQETLIQLLLKLQKDQSLTILFITHDLNLIESYGDRLLVLKEGILEESTDKDSESIKTSFLEKIIDLPFSNLF